MKKSNLTLSPKSSGLIVTLIYPVQFHANPVEGVDRVIATIVNATWRQEKPEDYRAAIEEALAGPYRLSELIPQDHPEEVIREYLAEVARRLAP